jgi:hypothetical protein
MDNFYVYVYLRSKNSRHGKVGTPYYVGKGNRMRAYSKNHRVRPPVDKTMIVFVAQNLSEPAAHLEEIRLIAVYGRIDLGTGCLRNLTDGGEGASGLSPAMRAKLSAAHKGIPWTAARAKFGKHSPDTLAKMSASHMGHSTSDETRAKLAAQAGWKHSEEARRKMSCAKVGYVPWNKGIRKIACRMGHPLKTGKYRQDCPTCRAARKREKRNLSKVDD